jgi:hypothetical protein
MAVTFSFVKVGFPTPLSPLCPTQSWFLPESIKCEAVSKLIGVVATNEDAAAEMEYPLRVGNAGDDSLVTRL